ncbi:MAG: hypothetical protein EOO70_06750, partial [Myxococcaceae bacterium]
DLISEEGVALWSGKSKASDVAVFLGAAAAPGYSEDKHSAVKKASEMFVSWLQEQDEEDEEEEED